MSMKITVIAGVLFIPALVFGQVMKIHTENSVERFSLSEVDSITFELDEEYNLSGLRIMEGEISGWSENADQGYIEFTSQNMYELLNGGAQEYVAKGMSKGFYQNKINGDKTFTYWLMDFRTIDNAEEMYSDRLQANSASKETAGDFSDDEAFITPSMYGYNGYAVFEHLMVVIWLDGYDANRNEAKNDIVNFLKVIKMKVADQ